MTSYGYVAQPRRSEARQEPNTSVEFQVKITTEALIICARTSSPWWKGKDGKGRKSLCGLTPPTPTLVPTPAGQERTTPTDIHARQFSARIATTDTARWAPEPAGSRVPVGSVACLLPCEPARQSNHPKSPEGEKIPARAALLPPAACPPRRSAKHLPVRDPPAWDQAGRLCA